MTYINHYLCSECGTLWDDEWDCTCDDRCPNCDVEIEPYASTDEDGDLIIHAPEVNAKAEEMEVNSLDKKGGK